MYLYLLLLLGALQQDYLKASQQHDDLVAQRDDLKDHRDDLKLHHAFAVSENQVFNFNCRYNNSCLLVGVSKLAKKYKVAIVSLPLINNY